MCGMKRLKCGVHMSTRREKEDSSDGNLDIENIMARAWV
jgi:hypothetical protein